MKKNIYSLVVVTFILMVSYGKTNTINTNATVNGVNGINTNTTLTALSSFEGNYDLIRMGSNDCGASIQLIRDCNGLMLLSNNHMGAEEFCNINRGQNRNSAIVTLEGNVIKSVVSMGERPGQFQVSYTNTLTLNSDGTLVKISNLKSRESRCLYQKR